MEYFCDYCGVSCTEENDEEWEVTYLGPDGMEVAHRDPSLCFPRLPETEHPNLTDAGIK